MSVANKIKFGLCQTFIYHDKVKNVENAIDCIQKCVKEHNVRVVVLPETFNCPYDTKYFAEYSETCPDGYTCKKMSALAKELGIYIFAGIIEKDGDKYYNCLTAWSPKGELMAKHRKLHLYDIFEPESPFKESDVFTPGDHFTTVMIDGRKFGLGICNDYRFDELARVYRNEGCEGYIIPFEINVAQSHYFDVLLRARAADTQMYVIGVSSARDLNHTYHVYGHSMVVDPYAKICCEASEKEECCVCELDFSKVEKVRKEVPLYQQRRTDLYDTVVKK